MATAVYLFLLMLCSAAAWTSRLLQRRPIFLSAMPVKMAAPGTVDFKLITYNILAPCYKTDAATGLSESTLPEVFMRRNRDICSLLLQQDADIICIQEFWAANDAIRSIYCDKLREHGYSHREVRRTSHWRTRKDGLACFVRDERIVLQDSRDIFFHDAGDRVAQLLLLAIQDTKTPTAPPQQFLLVHTHLLFPHNEFSSKIRMREMTKILGFIESYRQRELCASVCGRSDVRIPVILTGDMNGSPRGKVYQYITSQNYRSAMQENWSGDPSGELKWARWISHRNHRAQLAKVDHVFFLNPLDQTPERLPPVPDWTNLVFREVLERIRERQLVVDADVGSDAANSGFGAGAGAGAGASAGSRPQSTTAADNELSLRRAFEDFDEDNSQFVTRDEFEASLLELGFGSEGEPALTPEEIDLLVLTADKNGDGMIDFREFCDRFERALVCDVAEDDDCVPFARSTWLVDDLNAGSADRRAVERQRELEDQVVTDGAGLQALQVKELTWAGSQLVAAKSDSESSPGFKSNSGPASPSASERARQAVLARVIQQQADGTSGVANSVPSLPAGLGFALNQGSSSSPFTSPSTSTPSSFSSSSQIELSQLAVISKVLPDARPMGNLRVRRAAIWPKPLEEGTWPIDYTLSDHGMVSVDFSGDVVFDGPV